METIQTPFTDYHSNVDTSRPFSSVKEAVAVFGERFLTPQVYSPKPFSFPKQESSSSSWKFFSPTASPTHSQISSKQTSWKDTTIAEALKKLENELEETKEELKLLKERESENEVALASLNAELHKNMSKIAQAEAVAAGKASEASRDGEERRRDLMVKMEASPTLAHILNFTREEKEELFGRRKERKNTRKKKPIIPLVGDFFWRKKGSSTALHNPLYSSPHDHWN